jgi:hypothetical protein
MPRGPGARFGERLAYEVNPLGGFIVVALMAACDLRGTLCMAAMVFATVRFQVVSG